MRIDHVQVTAYLLIPGTMRWESTGIAVSAADGTYDVQGIGAGTYRLDVDPEVAVLRPGVLPRPGAASTTRTA